MQLQEASTALPALAPVAFDRHISDLLSTPLMRTLAAGWSTSEDRAYLVPILAWAHAALLAGPGLAAIRHEGENSSAYDAVFVGERQLREYESVLEAIGATGIDERSAPSFAKHFVTSVQSLYQGETLQAASTLVRGGICISAHLLATIHLAIGRANGAGPRESAPAALESAGVSPFESHPALGRLAMLYSEFLADLYAALRSGRMRDAADRIQSRKSLERLEEPPQALYPGIGEVMCVESDDSRGIEFTVERYPCIAEVLDPRVVRIPVGKYNNRHKHAHETLFYFISGTGEILVGENWVKVKPGDAVFSPRWAIHQTHNTGTEELVLLAITDYYLTSQIYVGKYDKI